MSTKSVEPARRPFSTLQTILLFLGVAGIVFTLSRFALMPRQRSIGENSPAVGKAAPNLAFEPLTSAKGIQLADQKGKVVLINFWGEWCGYCKVEFPHLVKLSKAYLDRTDFQLISVNVPGYEGKKEELADAARKFVAKHEAKFSVYLDPDEQAFDRLMETAQESQGGYPLTVIVDREGKIAGLWIGFQSGDEDDVARVLASALETNPKS